MQRVIGSSFQKLRSLLRIVDNALYKVRFNALYTLLSVVKGEMFMNFYSEMRNQAEMEKEILSDDDFKRIYQGVFEDTDEYKSCATCGKQMNMTKKEFKTLMHNQMHRYVCSSKCIVDFYK